MVLCRARQRLPLRVYSAVKRFGASAQQFRRPFVRRVCRDDSQNKSGGMEDTYFRLRGVEAPSSRSWSRLEAIVSRGMLTLWSSSWNVGTDPSDVVARAMVGAI